jgi:hypothetical protein
MTRHEAFIKLVKDLGFDPGQATDVRITDDHEHGQPRLHLHLIVPITREQVNEIRNAT